MIHVIATVNLNPGTRDAFLEVFHNLVPKVHAEDGCIAYGPTVDLESGLDVQSPLRENVVVIIEQWESLDHLHAHLAAPHMAEYRQDVKDYVQNVAVQVLEPA